MATTSIITYKPHEIVSQDTNYQGFTYNTVDKICTPTNHRTIGKWETLGKHFEGGLVKNKSFIDIGANFGFFNFKALEHGCSKTTAIESSKTYSTRLKKCITQAGIKNFDIVVGKYPKDTKNVRADIVMALSIFHHIYSKDKLKSCVNQLLSTFNERLIIEWIDVDDISMEKKKHHLNKDYTKSNFEKLLSQSCKIKEIGKGHHDTRTIYLVSK